MQRRRRRRTRPYLRTNETVEVSRGLVFVADQLEAALKDPYCWKWVILGLDNSLQNAIVAAVRDTAGYNILKNRKKWWAAFQAYQKAVAQGKTPPPVPDERLDDFWPLWKKAQGAAMARYHGGQPLRPTPAQKKAVGSLHGFRNAFVHFVPKSWSILTAEFPGYVNEACAVIRFLFESVNFPFPKPMERRRIEGALRRISKLTERHEKYLAALRAAMRSRRRRRRRR